DSGKRQIEHHKRALNRDFSAPPDNTVKGFAAYKFHHHEIVIIMTEEVVQGGNIRMIEFGKRNGFRTKAFDNFRLAGEIRAPPFDGAFAFEHLVNAFKDRTHAALAKFFRDPIVTYITTNHAIPPCPSAAPVHAKGERGQMQYWKTNSDEVFPAI